MEREWFEYGFSLSVEKCKGCNGGITMLVTVVGGDGD